MDGPTVAWVALGLTAAVQVAGFAFVIGVMRAKLEDVRRDFYRHRDLPLDRVHVRFQR